MFWGINTKEYLKNSKICKFYGDKQCPCVANKIIKKKYDKHNGFWTKGQALPDCSNCCNFCEIDINKSVSISFNLTLIEKCIALEQVHKESIVQSNIKRENKQKKVTPVKVELLSANGGTSTERLSKMIIGGALFGDVGSFLGLLGKDESNTKLVFKVTYADNNVKILVEKANSKEAKKLLSMVEIR